jgi:DNA-directed RNA polymerase subunit RPC12/RpoP
MVDYICANAECSRKVSGALVDRKIRCPHCSSKVLSKKQDRILDSIKAI